MAVLREKGRSRKRGESKHRFDDVRSKKRQRKRTSVRPASSHSYHSSKLAPRRRINGEEKLDPLLREVGVQALPSYARFDDRLKVLLVDCEDFVHSR
jgi:hypothetical protein